MAMDMRALYYVALSSGDTTEDMYDETLKANQNNLNQNFTLIAQKIEEIEQRLSMLE